MSADVCVLDFGMGNLPSVCRAVERAGAKASVSADPHEIERADRVVFPGVGSCGDALRTIRERGLDQAVKARVRAGRPTLGICVGMQVLLESSEEGTREPGLAILSGRVERFPASLGLAVPHMGWNQVRALRPHPVLSDGYYYFVHGYRAVDVRSEHVLATTEYGLPFVSAVGEGACVAVQFHPEKSQLEGIGLLQRFLSWSP